MDLLVNKILFTEEEEGNAEYLPPVETVKYAS